MQMRPAMLAWLVFAPAALGQSFNIDINRDNSPGAGGGVPSTPFGGAAGQSGLWNDIRPTGVGPFPLIGLDGAATNVTFSRAAGTGLVATNNLSSTGDYDRLLDDCQSFVGQSSITISNLTPGPYTVITYAITPYEDLNFTFVSVTSSTSNNPQIVGGVMPANGFIPGSTHSTHLVDIGPSGTLEITMTHGGKSGLGVVNGLQIIQRNPSRLYVRTGATGANSGLSWTHAFTSLDDALTAASAPGSAANEIWIAPGSHRPVRRTNQANARTATFLLRDGLTIRGGFYGTELSLSDRFPGAQPAILSGDIGAQGNTTDNAYHVVTMNTPGSALLDCVTISGGNANGSSNDAHGAGVFVSSGVVQLQHSTLRDNIAVGNGGGVAVLGGELRMSNTRLFDNTAANGGGVFVDVGASATLTNNSIAFNSSGVAGTGTRSIYNSIAWSNTGAQITPGADVRYSCVQNGYSGTGNIAIDPRFENVLFRNLRPLAGSRAIDAGSNVLASDAGVQDILLEPRFHDDPGRPDSGVGPAPVIDMGAYEFQMSSPPTTCAGDANGDSLINGADLSIMLSTFGQNVPFGSGADFNGDGVVNNADLSVLLSRWGMGC